MENSNNRYKFRAWDGKRMYYDVQNAYDNFSCNEDDEEKYGDNYTYGADFSFQSFKDVLEGAKSVMQTIGLKDKNGKEIYEGDVVRDTFFTKDWRWEIYFDTEEGRFWARKPGEVLGEFNCPDDPAYPRWHDYEVIGNIYEHSHLLNPAKD